MINKSNDLCTRRILNFPATRPSESVSFPTLLTSLISLGRSICSFKAKPIFTNRKNAKTSIHLVQTLLLFLEEIPQNKNPKISESSVLLSLSELHFTFQKLHFLLEDCGRENSRLWLLMQAEKVASLFHSLIRNISLALDVLPLSGLEVPCEAREMAELVNYQAWKAGFGVENDDKQAAGWVLRTIERFELEGIGPKSGDLKRVLSYLGIRTWNECNNEIMFLESLPGPECGRKVDEARFVCSLIAFLICCRCIVFENMEGSGSTVALRRFDFKVVGLSNLDDFRCPISLEIMADPVTIPTGHTYDRKSIAKWLDSGNRTCPKTGQRLKSVELIPNVTLKRLIMQWCHENEVQLPGWRSGNFTKSLDFVAGSRAADQTAKFIANFLVGKIFTGNDEERGKACYEIRLLTKMSIFCRSRLVEANAISALLDLVHHEKNREAEENAMAVLLNLSKLSEGKKLIIENRGVDIIIDALNRGAKMETRACAAGVLFYLSSAEGCRDMIGRRPSAITGLIGLVRSGPGRWRRNGLAAASGLLVSPENHRRFLSAGLVLTLVNALISESDGRDDVANLLAVLSILADKADGAKAIISVGGLPVIIKILGSFDNHFFSRAAIECCVSMLLALCTHDGPNVVPVLVRDVLVMPGLYSVLASGPGGPSKKAGLLIRILHEFGERWSSGPGFGPEQFVHAW